MVIAKARNGIVLDSGLTGKCFCINYYNPVCTLQLTSYTSAVLGLKHRHSADLSISCSIHARSGLSHVVAGEIYKHCWQVFSSVARHSVMRECWVCGYEANWKRRVMRVAATMNDSRASSIRAN